jgi:hypothetical protein
LRTAGFKVLTLKSQGNFPPPTDFYPEIPEGVLRALNGALAVELGNRFTDVGAFRRALDGVVLEEPAVVAAKAPKAEPVPVPVPVPESEAAIKPTDPEVAPGSTALKPKPKFLILSLVAVAVILFVVFSNSGDSVEYNEELTDTAIDWNPEWLRLARLQPSQAVRTRIPASGGPHQVPLASGTLR